MNLPLKVTISFFLIAMASPSFAEAEIPSWSKSATFDRMEGGKVHFKVSEPGMDSPAPIDTGLHDPEFLDLLYPAEGGIPYALLVGRPCDDCSREKSVYMIRADGKKSAQFVYPGKVRDAANRQLLLDSRAFYGRCLSSDKDHLVIFQKEKIDRRKYLQSSVFIAEPHDHYIREELKERRLPNISKTLKKVKSKVCREIQGWERLMRQSDFPLRKPRKQVPSKS